MYIPLHWTTMSLIPNWNSDTTLKRHIIDYQTLARDKLNHSETTFTFEFSNENITFIILTTIAKTDLDLQKIKKKEYPSNGGQFQSCPLIVNKTSHLTF